MLARAVARFDIERPDTLRLLRPMYQELLKNLRWRDDKGELHSGGPVKFDLGLEAPMTFSLILDDAPQPKQFGRTHLLSDAAEISLYVKKVDTEDQAVNTLYHEGAHVLYWLLNRRSSGTPDPRRRSGGKGSQRTGRTRDTPSGQTFGVKDPETLFNLSKESSEAKILRDFLTSRLSPVFRALNAARDETHKATEKDLANVVDFLVEELQVLAETDAFEIFLMKAEDRVDREEPVRTSDFMLDTIKGAIFRLSGVFAEKEEQNLDAEARLILGNQLPRELFDEYDTLVRLRTVRLR
jgi:hypothetical protein